MYSKSWNVRLRHFCTSSLLLTYSFKFNSASQPRSAILASSCSALLISTNERQVFDHDHWMCRLQVYDSDDAVGLFDFDVGCSRDGAVDCASVSGGGRDSRRRRLGSRPCRLCRTTTSRKQSDDIQVVIGTAPRGSRQSTN